MTRYVDASAVVKLYVTEPESADAARLLAVRWVAGRHTFVEVRRALTRGLAGVELDTARLRFAADWRATDVVELDRSVCERAAEYAEETGVRTLDALHLAAAFGAGGRALPIVTYDHRLAAAARFLGWTVLPE
ncbi:MAG: type II toxin-antitoxin system VapC family toxin [Gaiellaceae bacterium]